MKKNLLFFISGLLFFQFSTQAYAIEELKNVGIAKYAVLETIEDLTPLRDKDNENAKRLTHLYKGSVLFATKQNKNYYKVELSENNYAWINKKHVEVQAIIPEKRFDDISKISNKSTKNKFVYKIETDSKSPYQFIENGSNLAFKMYDVHFDPSDMTFSNKDREIKFPDKIENEFKINYVSKKPLFGYDFIPNEELSGYILTIKKPPKINPKKPLKNLVFTIDPGHGGSEKGVCAHGLEEKTINLQIAKKLKKELKKNGAKVYMTRTADKKVYLYDRTKFAREKESDFLLSIHQNSLARVKDAEFKHGVGTYYYHPQSKPLAENILNSLIKATNFRNDKVNYASFALTRPTSQISVLIECGYLIKKDEAEKLKDKKFQKIIASAIVEGCKNYLLQNFNAPAQTYL